MDIAAADDTYDEATDRYVSRRREFARWLNDIAQTAGRVALSDAAIIAIERGMGREMHADLKPVAAWVVNMCWDLESELMSAGHHHERTLPRIAADNAVAIVRSRAISHLTGLRPHAAAQVNMVMTHIEDNHL